MELVQAARARGQDVSCELTAHHLILSEEDALELGGAVKCAPPLRPRAEVDALWPSLATDETLFVVSDHSPSPPQLERSDDFFEIWGGIAGIQQTVELILSEASPSQPAPSGRIDLAVAPRALAGAAAARFGLPNKGALDAGMDADLALIELGASAPSPLGSCLTATA